MAVRLTLLLICLCTSGVSSVELGENSSVPLVPLIPLMPLLPSHPVEKAENESTVQTTEAPLVPLTNETSAGVDDGDGGDDGGCVAVARGVASRRAVAAAVQRLGVELLRNLEATPEQPNVIISPLSIGLALSQLALGAVNETEELLMHHLHEHTVACYHQALHSLLALLRDNELQIATRIFLRQGFEPKPDFVLESRRLYESEPAVLESLQQINDWVENATNGKMNDFLSALPPNVLLMLINAVHFKGEWTSRFDPRFTSRGVFYLDDKRMVDVEVMEDAKHPLSIYMDKDLDAWVARFPFLKSKSMLVVRPISGQVNVTSLSAKLNISNLYNNLPKERAVQVKFPKFKLEYAQDLKEVFTKLGLGAMFSNPNLANLADGPLLVSSVMHKSSMELNEDGAEAAAATAVVITRSSSPVFHLNQPFFFALIDDITQVPMFMGVINNPNPGGPVLDIENMASKDKTGFPNDKSYSGGFGGPPK